MALDDLLHGLSIVGGGALQEAKMNFFADAAEFRNNMNDLAKKIIDAFRGTKSAAKNVKGSAKNAFKDAVEDLPPFQNFFGNPAPGAALD